MSLFREMSSSQGKQRTLKQEVSLAGTGLFTGSKVHMRFCPAPENTGIVFKRTDLEGHPTCPALAHYVIDTPRCTIIGKGKCKIQSVEHVLAAIAGYGIDNLYIELHGPEVPIGDGSAVPFIDMIEKAGISFQSAKKQWHRITAPIFWTSGDVHLVALPYHEFRISYTLNYPNSKLLRSQFYTFAYNEQEFKEEIAPCRTFSLYEEIVPLIEKSQIKGGSLENALVIKGDAVLNPEGLHFPDEMARHKILDMIGDLSLTGMLIQAHIIALRSGHRSNTAFAKEILNALSAELATV